MILQNFNIKITSRFQALNLNLIKTIHAIEFSKPEYPNVY